MIGGEEREAHAQSAGGLSLFVHVWFIIVKEEAQDSLICVCLVFVSFLDFILLILSSSALPLVRPFFFFFFFFFFRG
ncbi:hypothetical protein QBC42DRAFT_112268 [Cladorrhinum samala]|uniref:Transmembrane protein n=1 Tax=Cladorrhinum samala TaxID=585594 RepID=A0AAV9HIT0_9PEZI|nr:hypothetical protein QBC42DRAFT_112268 [Cladorrhinum samala]